MFVSWKKEKKNRNFQIFEYQLYRKAIAFDKINHALSSNSTKICLLYFCMQNSYLLKTVQNYDFREQKNRLVLVIRYSLKSRIS